MNQLDRQRIGNCYLPVSALAEHGAARAFRAWRSRHDCASSFAIAEAKDSTKRRSVEPSASP